MTQGRLYPLQEEQQIDDGVTVIDRRRSAHAPRDRTKRDVNLPWTKMKTTSKVELDLGEFILQNDSNDIAFVYWKQHTTDMIFILTCSAARTTSFGRLKNKGCENYGNLYISDNLGEHFKRQDKESLFVNYWIHSIYLSVLDPKYVIAADYHNKTIFITRDEAVSFKRVKLEFAPTFIELHPTVKNLLAAFDITTQSLWWSEDYGQTWRIVSRNVKKYFWQNDKLASDAKGFYFERIDVLLQRVDGEFESTLVHFPLPTGDNKVASESTIERGLVQDSVHLGDEFVLMQKVSDRQIYVIRPKYEQHPVEVIYRFKNSKYHVHHGVISTENNEILLSVFHPDTTVTVYLSDPTGRNMYFVTDDVIGGMLLNKTALPKVDFYRVKGLTTTYIINKKDNGTLISFDKGVFWQHLNFHRYDKQDNALENECKASGNSKCILNLYISVEQVYSTYTSAMLSKESAPGVIIAQGQVGGPKESDMNMMNTDHYVFISSDGGRLWKQTLGSSHGYAILNHGNVIAATPLQFTVKQEIKFSTDYGQTWLRFTGTHRYSRIAAVVTDSTAKTLVINVFGFLHEQPLGSDVGNDQWVIWKFNFSRVFDRVCCEKDYYRYQAAPLCTGGETVSFLRANLKAVTCYSPPDHDIKLERKSCPCTKRDLMCEDTYIIVPLDGDTYTCKAVYEHLEHHYCNQNGYYYKSNGYRKIQGNKCTKGVASQLLGTYKKCIVVRPVVQIQASRTTAGLNKLIEFKIAHSVSTFDTKFTWYFGDGTKLTGNFEAMREVTHAYPKMGHYLVQLIAQNSKASYNDSYSVVVLDKTYHNSFIMFHSPIVAGQENTFELKRLDKNGETKDDLPPHSIDTKFLWSFKGIYGGDTKSHQVKHTFEKPGIFQVECQIISPMINVQTVIRTVHVYKAAYVVDLSFSPYLDRLNTGTATWINDFLYKLKSFIVLRHDIDDVDERVITEIKSPGPPLLARVIVCDVEPIPGEQYKSAESLGKRIESDIVKSKPVLIGFHYADIHVTSAKLIGYIQPVSKDSTKVKPADHSQSKIWIYVVVMLILLLLVASLVIYLRLRRKKSFGGGCHHFWRGIFVRKDNNDIMEKKLVFHTDEDCVGLEGPDLPQYVSD